MLGLVARARELRGRGYTYKEITGELGVSKGSVSLWTRDMPRVGRISYEEIRQRNSAGVSAFWAAESLRREARRQAVSDAAAAEIGSLTDREVIIAGAIAYWCEGAKNKPYRRLDNEVAFINSDPKMILFFLRFLAVAGIERDRVYCRVSIHESADVDAALRFWQQLTELPLEQFKRPTLKRHNPKTIRKNTGNDYHGCLIVRVRKGCELYRQIEGWAAAVMAVPTETEVGQEDRRQLAGLVVEPEFAPRGGLEPPTQTPKDCVLPLTPPGNGGSGSRAYRDP